MLRLALGNRNLKQITDVSGSVLFAPTSPLKAFYSNVRSKHELLFYNDISITHRSGNKFILLFPMTDANEEALRDRPPRYESFSACCRRLDNLRLSNFKNVEEYVVHTIVCHRKLKEYDCVLPESYAVHKFLEGLGTSFGAYRVGWTMNNAFVPTEGKTTATLEDTMRWAQEAESWMQTYREPREKRRKEEQERLRREQGQQSHQRQRNRGGRRR